MAFNKNKNKNVADNDENKQGTAPTAKFKKEKKLGGIRTMPFIFANEICDRFATTGSHANMITYLTQELNMPLVKASNTLSNFSGTANFTPLIGAFIADSFAGRFWTITFSSIIYLLGLVSVTVSALLPSLRPPPCPSQVNCKEASASQLWVLYMSLILTSLGSGGIKPCVVTFGADQFDMTKSGVASRGWNLFNWYYFSMGMATLTALTVVVYIQDNVGWGWGLGIPTIAMAFSLLAFVFGSPLYIKLKPEGSPLVRLVQVIVAAFNKRNAKIPTDPKLLYNNRQLDDAISLGGRLLHSNQFRWWQHWVEYVNQDQSNNLNDTFSLSDHYELVDSSVLKRPGGIDNSGLIYDAASEDSNPLVEIHDTLLEGRDYILLPQEVWNQLLTWYGGGPTLARKVISSGLSQTDLAVEVYPLRLQLLVMPKGDRSTLRISKKETIGELHRRACEIFDLNSEQVCIWDYYGRRKHALMNDMHKTLDDVNIQMDQDILVEVLSHVNATTSGGCLSSVQSSPEKEATSILVEPSKSSLSIAGGLAASKGAPKNYATDIAQSQSPAREPDNTYGTSGVCTRGSSGGLTGLLNLGNTCFMNSAIQCLVHTPEFARYFQEDYHREINWQNPLGMVGELALAFGELLRKLWAPGRTAVAPRPFKAKLARFAPQFSGYNQHDSQELLAFLLDGLHEDLNRVKHKPYIKSRDADGRLDEEVADEYWANHIARNDSIIVDVCQGQYKSTLVCPVCNKVSVTFDPFMYLSLPLQSTNTRTMTVTVFTCDGSALPSVCTVTVPKQGRCRDLVQALSNACSLNPSEKLVLVEIHNHLVQRILEDPLISLSTIKDDDHLAAYKTPKFLKKTKYLQLIHCQGEQGASDKQVSSGWKPYGTPLVMSISCDNAITYGDIQTMVQKMLSPFQRSESPDRANASDTSTPTVASDTCRDLISGDACTSSGVSSSHKDGPSSIEATLPKLPLQLVVGSDACIDLSVAEEKTIELSSSASILVYVDWSQKLLENYNSHYVENLPEVFKFGPVTKKARSEPLSLYTCLEAFLREEPLVPEDMWYCPQCKERRQASKKLDLWRLPEVLVIHLKRFSYSRSMKHKLETFVNFPIHNFDLTNYVANKNNSHRQLYELYALTNHYGGMGSGHYTAYIKLLDENRWYNFDDSHISPINEEDVKSAAAYVLFYRRVKTEDASLSNGVQSCAGANNASLP